MKSHSKFHAGLQSSETVNETKDLNCTYDIYDEAEDLEVYLQNQKLQGRGERS